MPSRLTIFRFGAALVIGLAFAIWPRDSAYAISLFLFLLASGAGFVEDLLARRVGADGLGERTMRQAAHRALSLAAMIGLLVAERDLAALLAPPLLAAVIHDAARGPLREALAHRGARLREGRLAWWRARLEFLALAALLSGPVVDGPADSALQPLGLLLLWVAMVSAVWEGWRDCAAALSHLRRDVAETSAQGEEATAVRASAPRLRDKAPTSLRSAEDR